MAKVTIKGDAIYVCVSGFVPGLPSECTLEQARTLGLEAELQAAIENAVYIFQSVPAALHSEKREDKGVTHG